ncbi:MAG TPA: glycoside hydrolase family protein [Candidatus Methylacidiphilales bacterium]
MKSHTPRPLLLLLFLVAGAFLPLAERCRAEEATGIGPKPFIDYFLPIPVSGELSKDAWGAAAVGPRDPDNGLEDREMKQWDYWDGKILRGADGKYRMFASRWDQAKGHFDWYNSKAVSAISDSPLGPYREQGLLWPDDQGGKGHNVTALQLPDGGYAVIVSETRNGDVFTSASIDGPWKHLGTLQVDQDRYHALANPGDRQPLQGPNPKGWHGSNVSLIARPGGGFEMTQRSGQILISKDQILGPYEVQGDSIYRGLPGLPQDHLDRLEDPVLWFSGGWYHIVVNNWGDRRAYHLISRDGITGWKFQGVAYYPQADFIRYSDGTVNHWNKLERPGVLIEDGHVTAITLAVIDVAKEQEKGNDGHGSKVIVIPFDGAAMDRDLANADQAP